MFDDGSSSLMCLIGVLMLLFAAQMIAGNRGERERHEGPKIRSARVIVGECIGEFIVTASHSEHVLRDMDLPYGSVVTIDERNQQYKVRFPLPEKRTPPSWKTRVWDDDGSWGEARVNYGEEAYHQDFVRDAAAQNGYTGRVEKW